MSLVPDNTTKGLWRSATPRGAGVHALIIGISGYPHLEGGPKPLLAPYNGGMGQLEVCAKTAARIFDWMKNAGAIAGTPVATCRLHLGPRPAEQAEVTSLTQDGYGPANFKSIREATEAWRDDIAAGETDPNPNVAFFFFSGHGLDHVSRPSLLCDNILDPRSPGGPKNAVSFNALWQSVKTYGIDRALFFVDACRNVSDIARTLHIVGEEVIQPADYTTRWPDAVVWLQATRSGAFAYQLPTGPATFFGQALLEALEGIPPDYVPYDRTGNPWQLIFTNLESYMKQRVRALLAQQSATRLQLIQPSGDPYNGDTIVSEKAGIAVAQGLPLPLPPPPTPGQPSALPTIVIEASINNLITSRSDEILGTFQTATAAKLDSFRSTARSKNDYRGDLSVTP